MLPYLSWVTLLASVGLFSAPGLAHDGAIDRSEPVWSAGGSGPGNDPAPGGHQAAGRSSPAVDPAAMFQQLVERYRSLSTYRDHAQLVQVTCRDGAETDRVEAQIVCEIDHGELRVRTSSGQARQTLGLKLPVFTTQEFRNAQRAYELWLAPHMALKFRTEPLTELRAGVVVAFTPTEAETVTIDEKPMLHLELRSSDGQNEDGDATVDLFVNPDSMLVERIETEQRLPDGANFTTTLHIQPEPIETPLSDAISQPGSTLPAVPASSPEHRPTT